MGGFHDTLREKPSSLLMLFGWSSISISSLIIWSTYLDFLVRILVLCTMVYAVLSYGRLLTMGETDMSLMFFDPRLN
jgi:hypothetical protein